MDLLGVELWAFQQPFVREHQASDLIIHVKFINRREHDKNQFSVSLWKLVDCRSLIQIHSRRLFFGSCDSEFYLISSRSTPPIHYETWKVDSYQCQAHYNFLLHMNLLCISKSRAHSNFLWKSLLSLSLASLNKHLIIHPAQLRERLTIEDYKIVTISINPIALHHRTDSSKKLHVSVHYNLCSLVAFYFTFLCGSRYNLQPVHNDKWFQIADTIEWLMWAGLPGRSFNCLQSALIGIKLNPWVERLMFC